MGNSNPHVKKHLSHNILSYIWNNGGLLPIHLISGQIIAYIHVRYINNRHNTDIVFISENIKIIFTDCECKIGKTKTKITKTYADKSILIKILRKENHWQADIIATSINYLSGVPHKESFYRIGYLH